MNRRALDQDLALRRLRLLLGHVGQECGFLHPEIDELALLVGSYDRERDTQLLTTIRLRLACVSSDCPEVSHCELVRKDLLSELDELISLATR